MCLEEEEPLGTVTEKRNRHAEYGGNVGSVVSLHFSLSPFPFETGDT